MRLIDVIIIDREMFNSIFEAKAKHRFMFNCSQFINKNKYGIKRMYEICLHIAPAMLISE